MEELREIILRFKHDTYLTNQERYDDQMIDGEMQHVNFCLPYVLRDVMEPGDQVHELSPMGMFPFYVWFQHRQINSAVISTVAGDEIDTTILRFRLVEADSPEELISSAAAPFFQGSLYSQMNNEFYS
jgi:hypothetical protein